MTVGAETVGADDIPVGCSDGVLVGPIPPPQAQHAERALIPSIDVYSARPPHDSDQPIPGLPFSVQ